MTTYAVRQIRGLEVDDRDPENRKGWPKLIELGTYEAHGPEAAALAAAEENPDCVNVDFGFDLEAVPVRNRHRVSLKPKSGFELAPPEGSLLDPSAPAGPEASAAGKLAEVEGGGGS